MSSSQNPESRMTQSQDGLTYEAAGVVESASVVEGLLTWVNRTLPFRKGQAGESCLDIGFYANVLDLGHGLGLAFSTDGVGTKILIAEMMGRYDTIGIDCVAMNVNDLICVGAEPLAMLDYIAVHTADPQILTEVGKGLYLGARDANISIPGGELAQLGNMIGGLTPGSGLDLVGACVGLVMRGGRMLLGQEMQDGDALIGLASSGIHSNGHTLARESLFGRGGLSVESRPDALPHSLGEELLTPTRIYVKPALQIIREVPGLRALAHVTSDGFLNLLRIPASFRYQIDWLPPVPPIFDLIQQAGGISTAEMYRVFNMGIGLCAVVAPSEVAEVLRICSDHHVPAWRIGTVTRAEVREVVVEPADLHGRDGHFEPVSLPSTPGIS